MKKKVGMVSLGCSKNLVDSEIMLGHLKESEYEIVADEKDADIIIVNTCGFIETARQESVNAIIEMAQHKKQKCSLLIVTGCLAEKYKHEISEEIPEVDAIIGTGSYSDIVSVITEAQSGLQPERFGDLLGTDYLNHSRIISTGRSTAYIKIAEGCDNCCTYCIIPSLRGKFRSRTETDILKEAEGLAADGIKEVILIAQDTTRYGLDLYKEKRLPSLIRQISKIYGIEWVRLLYLYPEELDDTLINEISKNSKVCKYFDIPVQHASPQVLKKMGRRGSAEETENLLLKIRRIMPDAVLRTSIIVGFPGETENDFEILRSFVKKLKFDRLGVFEYSKEVGTPSAKMKEQIPARVKKSRHKAIMTLQQQISKQANLSKLGKTFRVLCEGIAEDGIFYYGRSFAEAPDTDGIIYFTAEEIVNPGDFVYVTILNSNEYDLIGEVTNEPAQ